jgi:hypothetical protein
MPLIIELGTIKRVKMSPYTLAEKYVIMHPIIKELIIFTDIKMSGSKSIQLDDLQYRPWYMFFEINLDKQHIQLV